MRATPRFPITAALCGLMAMASVRAGDVYRWVDRAGVAHYSDVPVAGAQQVTPAVPGRSQDPGRTAADPGAQEQDAVADPQSAEALAARCEQKKQQLASYQSSVSIVERDALGKEHEYSPQEREQLIAATRSEIEQLCGGAPAA
jgi:hypothetical protein